VAFDVLAIDGFDLMRQPYRQRRRLLEEFELAGPHVSVPESFEDGEETWSVGARGPSTLSRPRPRTACPVRSCGPDDEFGR
jgi:hypothetical protein